ncbi:MAG: hypothetical protein WCJ99_15380, partial [Betaproteobacteria bacterium]
MAPLKKVGHTSIKDFMNTLLARLYKNQTRTRTRTLIASAAWLCSTLAVAQPLSPQLAQVPETIQAISYDKGQNIQKSPDLSMGLTQTWDACCMLIDTLSLCMAQDPSAHVRIGTTDATKTTGITGTTEITGITGTTEITGTTDATETTGTTDATETTGITGTTEITGTTDA